MTTTWDRLRAERDALLATAESVVGDSQYGIVVERIERDHPNWGTELKWVVTDPHEGQHQFAFAWYPDEAPPVDVYTRSQYEAAWAAAGVPIAYDATLGTYADRFADPTPSGSMPPAASVEMILRRRRMAGIAREVAPPESTPLPDIDVAPPITPQDQVPAILGFHVPSDATRRGICHYCGLDLVRGRCEECV